MSALYATFDPLATSPLLALEQGNTVVTHMHASGASGAAWSTIGLGAGQRAHAELILYGDGDIGDAAVGVSTARLTDGAIGNDATSIGWRSNGIWTGGSRVRSVPLLAKGVLVSLDIDMSGDELMLVWRAEGELVHAMTLPNAGPWYIGASMSGGEGLRCLLNTGQQGFERGDLVGRGWIVPRISPETVRVASQGWLAPADSDTPHARYRGVLSAASKLISAQGIALPAWSKQSISGQRAEASLANGDAIYDGMVVGDYAGATVRVMRDDGQQALFEVIAAASPQPGDVRVTMGAAMSRLDTLLARRRVRPDADDESAGTPWPLAFGVVRSVEPVLIDGSDQRYALSEEYPRGLGKVRTMGDQLDAGSDYSLNAGGDLILSHPAHGTVTVDFSTVGGAVPDPLDDVLGGDGTMDNPSAWLIGGPGSPPGGSGVHDGVLWLRNSMFAPVSEPGTSVWARPANWVPVPGMMYLVTWDLPELSGGSRDQPARMEMQFGDASGPERFSTAFVTQAAGSYRHVFKADARRLYFAQPRIDYDPHGNHSESDTRAKIDNVRIYEIDQTPSDDDELEPIKFEDLARDILERRLGWEGDQWSAADAAALDSDTGYAGIGILLQEPTSARQVLELALENYHAAMIIDRAGVLRFRRIIAPETAVPAGEFVSSGPITVAPDTAPGLSVHASGRRNWRPLTPSEIVTDTTPGTGVPLSERAMLGRDYRVRASYSGALHSMYRSAMYAPSHKLLLDRPEDIQAWVDYMGSLYPPAAPRRFFDVPVVNITRFAPGDVWVFRHDRYGLSNGVPLLVTSVKEDILARSGTITLWG